MSRKIDGKNGNEDEDMDTHDRDLMTTVRAVFAEESEHGIQGMFRLYKTRLKGLNGSSLSIKDTTNVEVRDGGCEKL